MEFLKLIRRKNTYSDTMGMKMSQTKIRLENSEGKIREIRKFSGIYYIGQ